MNSPATPPSPAQRLAWTLSLLGVLPFALATLALWFAPTSTHAIALQTLGISATLIIAFLGGVQWGLGVGIADQAPRSAQTLYLLSVVSPLLAAAILLVPSLAQQLMIAVFLFGFLWIVDTLLKLQGLIAPWFWRLRTRVTLVVIVCLLAVLPKLPGN